MGPRISVTRGKNCGYEAKTHGKFNHIMKDLTSRAFIGMNGVISALDDQLVALMTDKCVKLLGKIV